MIETSGIVKTMQLSTVDPHKSKKSDLQVKHIFCGYTGSLN